MKIKNSLKIEPSELKLLMFWASYGFSKASGGSGMEKLPVIYEKFRKKLKGTVPKLKEIGSGL